MGKVCRVKGSGCTLVLRGDGACEEGKALTAVSMQSEPGRRRVASPS